MPQRFQRKRIKGWQKPAGSVIINRSSRWGNPFELKRYERTLSLKLFRDLIFFMDRGDKSYMSKTYFTSAQIRRELGGKDVCCWCGLDESCHGDILLEIANS